MDQAMKFAQLCETFEKISHAPKAKKFKILNQLISACRESNNTLVPSFFSLVRLLVPELDFERRNYGVKETKLANIYIRILCLSKNSQEANKLLKFRSATAGNSAGDFADVAFWILKRICGAGGELTVDDVNGHLDKIASFNASGKPKCVDAELTDTLHRMSPEEQKWFIRLLLKDLRLGVGQKAILNTIHLDASELFNTCNNLRKVSETLREKEKRLHEIEITLFEPCRPMRSERYDITKVEALFKSSPFYYVEKKHDGERFQIHIQKGSFRYFSRNAVDYTQKQGDSIDSLLTPLLAKQLHPSVESCILDGELMGWNTQDNCFGRKSKHYDVKNMKFGNEYRPCFCVFDILMLNGEVLTNKPFQERTKYLPKVYTPLDGVLMGTPQHCFSSSLEIMKALNDAIDHQEEGLILKHPLSIYKPAAKNGGGWYKIKPEYTVGLTDELDLIIIGGLFGKGKNNSNIISHFLLGVAVAPEDKGKPPTEFHSVCRVGSGYSNKELEELLEKLSPHWKPVMGAPMPPGLVWTKERPDLWIEPRNSHLLQVKASEITPTYHYKAGFTLNFPRVVEIRYDKNWFECCDTEEFKRLRLSNCGKLAIRHVNAGDLTQVSPTKRQRVRALPAVGVDHRAADLCNLVKGSLLSGREICVFSGNSLISKQDLEKRIHEQGGTIVQNRGPDTFCVVAGKLDFRLRNLSVKGDIDVVTVKWFLDVLNNERLTEWEPEDLLIMSTKTCREMKLRYDSFFDSYHKPTTEEKLKKSLEKVSEQRQAVNLLPIEMGDIDVELFSDSNEFAVFRCCTAFFVPPHQEGESFACSLLKAMFVFQGGRVSESETSDVTHVVIGARQQKEYEYYQQRNHSRFKKFYIVTYDWIEHCWSHQRHLHERDYYPNSLLNSSK
ncbi:DNA ligase 4-like isoform X2 [Thrips palmi]|uniref:DNA ligase 4 n=1 Tax=Thrips palmi TaxID=161013 RepID=A0A6P8YHN2_THRPL|nr:DNA ligase 4-like isoform X2 [Thrips palmi]